MPDLFVNRQQHIVHNQKPVPGVFGNRDDLLGMQAKIERMQNSARARHPKKHLQMAGMVPHHGSNPIAGLEAERSECRGKPTSPPVEVPKAGADNRAIRSPRGNLNSGKDLACPLQQRGERQGEIHHGSAHGSLERVQICWDGSTPGVQGKRCPRDCHKAIGNRVVLKWPRRIRSFPLQKALIFETMHLTAEAPVSRPWWLAYPGLPVFDARLFGALRDSLVRFRAEGVGR